MIVLVSPGSTIAYVVLEKKQLQIRITPESRVHTKGYFSDSAFTRRKVAELIRTAAGVVTLFKSVGTALEDLVAAELAVR